MDTSAIDRPVLDVLVDEALPHSLRGRLRRGDCPLTMHPGLFRAALGAHFYLSGFYCIRVFARYAGIPDCPRGD